MFLYLFFFLLLTPFLFHFFIYIKIFVFIYFFFFLFLYLPLSFLFSYFSCQYKGANFSEKSENFLACQLSRRSPDFMYPCLDSGKFQPEWRRWKLFQFGKILRFYSKIWLIGIFAVEDYFPINRKIFHFSNFFKNSEILFVQAYKCANFQIQWSRWKILL